MLRQVVCRRSCSSLTVRRWLNAAAATSKQKRALNKSQLKGSSSAAADETHQAAKADSKPPTPPPPPPPSGDGGGSSDNNMLPLALAGLAAVGGIAYYSMSSSTPEEEPKQEAPPSQPEETKEAKEEAPETTTTTTEEEDDSTTTTTTTEEPNRVQVIPFPEQMRNTAAETPETQKPEPHPEGGNRVGLVPSPKKPQVDVEDASMTEQALAKLQKTQTEESARALRDSHQSAWTELQLEQMKDLDSLSKSELQARIVQLAAEIKDRTKWEAVRLKEFLAMKEKETANQYMEILQTQRLEFEDLLAKRLREKEHELSDKMHAALREKDASIQSAIESALQVQKEEHEADLKTFEEITAAEIKTQLDSEYSAKMTAYQEQVTADLEQKVATLQSLTQKLSHLEAALADSKSSKEGSVRAHRLSAAALALAEKLETSQSAAPEVQALKVAAGTDGVIATALATLPSVAEGVPTISELQDRFVKVHKKSRQAAMVPAGQSGLEGQIAGMVLATVKYAPSPDEAAPEENKDAAEYVLVRAQKYVQMGELEQAVDQLEKLTGQAAFTVADWKQDAMRRVAVEKALKVIKMECALLNESLVA